MKYIADSDRNQLLISSKARAQTAAQFDRKFPQKQKRGWFTGNHPLDVSENFPDRRDPGR
jgi:hypothetical protein